MSIFKGTAEPKKIIYGEPITVSDMQGPCDNGFHIPTDIEWQGIIDIFTTLGISSVSNFQTYLKLPRNGGRSYDTSPLGGAAKYWTCIRTGNYGEMLSFDTSISVGIITISAGLLVRAFKNTPITPDSNWTALYSDKIYHNSTLGLISISGDGDTRYTIADKNVGATTVWNYGDTVDNSNSGGLFQRGNNYMWQGVNVVPSPTSSGQVNASTYGPGNYYNRSAWVTALPRDNSSNTNLRGGVTQGTSEKTIEVTAVYLGDTKVRPEIVPDYLCFTANTAGSTIKLNSVGNPYPVTLETSTDRKNWSTYTFGTTITLSNVGDTVYWRNVSETTTRFSLSSSFSDCYKFVMTGSIAASGDINFLLNKNSTTTVSDYCYFNLFEDCASLTMPPKLTATTLGYDCYGYMFYNCSALVGLPELPATTLPDFCYYYMFRYCSNVTLSTTQSGVYQTPYRIPTTGTGTVGSSSMNNMFRNTGASISTPTINTTYYTSNTVIPSNLSTS